MGKEKTEVEALHALGAATKLVTEKFNGVEHVLIPPNSEFKSLEHLMPNPVRIVAKPVFSDVAGFLDYIKEFQQDGTRIFIDDSDWDFTTVFDCHSMGGTKGAPEAVAGWCDHKAKLDLTLAREWERFKKMDGVKLDQQELAEFLEDNVAYVTGPVKGVDLLSMAQNINVKLKGDIQIEETVSKGLKSLHIQDDSVIRGTNAAKKLIKFPEKLALSLRVFKNQAAFNIDIHLRMRRKEQGLQFWITIPDYQAIEEEAFDIVIEEVKEKSRLPTLKGYYSTGRNR